MYQPITVCPNEAANAPFNSEIDERYRWDLRMEPNRGPHECRELYLMEKCQKPFAMMNVSSLSKVETQAFLDNNSQFHCDVVSDFYGFRHLVIYRRGHDHRINMWRRTCKMYRNRAISWETYTIRFGRLLGYSKEQILYFIQNRI